MPTKNKNIAKKRVKKLFTEIKTLADQPIADAATIPSVDRVDSPALQAQQDHQREVKRLNVRIRELESLLSAPENGSKDQKADSSPRTAGTTTGLKKDASSSAPMLYEKEQVGYVYRDNDLSPLQSVSSVLPESIDLRTAQLIDSGQVIGSMRFQPPAERSLTAEDESLANAVAQQASLQIQNLRLLSAAERARLEAQEATRQFTHQSWESFLDGIRNSERIGYSYNQDAVEAFIESSPAQHDYEQSVQVLDEQIGKLFVQADPSRPLTFEDQAMINSVAAQISQQVENIRLLADAARARADAEAATRRLTRENWEAFAEEQDDESLGFIYDSNTVTPIGSTEVSASVALEQPLVVQGQSIGQLKVMGMENLPSEAKGLAESIATQASIHLETLRLNEELQQRARELQELDRLKSAFLANMSHELRTPLNSILGFTDVMLEGLDGPLTEYMDNDLRLIQKNGQHLLHLINDVLDMAKIESGRMNLNPEKFKVHDIFEDVNSITSSLANARNTELIITDESDSEVEIYADNTRVKQVMINLVNNAIKFTTNGKITMGINKMDGARVMISVKDTGLGIPPDHLESIFQEFSQVDTSTTRKVGGTGLGLPISRRLIEMHGGRLWAESTGVEGEGSTFFIELPLEARITEVVEKQEK
ncbi:MAG TPA: ATP-binding protein [Anaerolineales bacterium]|nr:ATP-binding protein [Anaerolineales bacterium]